MKLQGFTELGGVLAIHPIRQNPGLIQQPIIQIFKRGLPRKNLNPAINAWRRDNLTRLIKPAFKIWLAEQMGVAHTYGALYLEIIRPMSEITDLLKKYADIYHTLNGLNFQEWASDYGIIFKRQRLGLAGLKVVTTAGVNFLVDALQGSVEPEILKYHGIGTGSTAEAVGDTALVTELTTEYNPDSTRATGSLTEGASANIFRTVGTNTLDGTPGAALREHGIFSQAATGGGTLLDRTVYGAITLSAGDGLQSTYDFTISAGS